MAVGPPHVVDVALELRVGDDLLGLGQDGFVAPGLDDPSLVEGEGAEAARAEAAPAGDQAELHLRDGGTPPSFS